MFGKTSNLRCVKVWFHAFSVKRNQNKGSLIPGNPGVPGDRRGSQCTPNSPCPHKKNCLLIDISPDLPTPNILFSPSSQHFLSNFSLLPTFSGHFSLLPTVYLPHLSVTPHRGAFATSPKQNDKCPGGGDGHAWNWLIHKCSRVWLLWYV